MISSPNRSMPSVLYEKLVRHLAGQPASAQSMAGQAAGQATAIQSAPVIQPAPVQLTMPAVKKAPSVAADMPLLNMERLEQLRSIGFLNEYLSDNLKMIDPLLSRIDASLAAQNFEELHERCIPCSASAATSAARHCTD